MHRFYVKKIDRDYVTISDAEQLHHLKDVLRLKVNDEVTVFDGDGNECVSLISEMDKTRAVLAIKATKSSGSKPVKITVACALPKKSGMDEIVDSLTQLGVDTIIPLATARVIVKLPENKKEARLERWRRIAQSAAQQSQRNDIPLIGPVTSLEKVVAQSQVYDLKLILAVYGERKHITEALASVKPTSILVLIGPEGDFTQEEIGLAKSAGFIPVSLGDTVLRVSTAATAVASYIKFCLLG
ncbi:MAG: RsmE family RNA methyltransferase [Chloroflexota bacterium]